jgi:hypothetical protein
MFTKFQRGDFLDQSCRTALKYNNFTYLVDFEFYLVTESNIGTRIAWSVWQWYMGRMPGVRFLAGARDFSLFTASKQALEPTQPHI